MKEYKTIKKTSLYTLIILVCIISNSSIVTAKYRNKYTDEYSERVIKEANVDNINVINELKNDLKNNNYETTYDKGRINYLLGYAYYKSGDLKKSESYLIESIRIFKNIKDINQSINAYMLLVNIYYNSGDYKNSLIYSSNILNTLKNNSDIEDDIKISAQISTLSILITTCKYFGFESEVDKYLEELEHIMDKNDVYENKLSIDVKVNYYVENGEYDKAYKLINEYLDLINKKSGYTENDINKLKCYLAMVYIGKGDYDKAKLNIEEAKKYYNSVDSKYDLAKVHLIEGDYYKNIKDYEKSLRSYKNAHYEFNNKDTYFWAGKAIESIINVKIEINDVTDIIKYIEKLNIYKDKYQKEEEDLIRELLNMNNKLIDYEMDRVNEENEVVKIKNVYITKLFNVVVIISMVLVVVIVILIKEMNNRKKSENKLREIMSKDYLTDAYTREYTYSKIEEFIENEYSITMALMDLDNFKNINDNYGHLTGDHVLKKVSSIVLKHIDKDDVFGRFGGEEFLIVFNNKDVNNIYMTCEKIRADIENTKWDCENLVTTVSIGIKEYEGESIDSFTKMVDERLYKAKNSGKNKICI